MQHPRMSLLGRLSALSVVATVLFSALGLAVNSDSASAAPYAALTTTQSSDGYWSVSPDGIVTSSGAATFYGDLRASHLNQRIVGMARTPGDRGYWLVGADGGIFSFGDAPFFGSTGAMTLNQPIVGMASTASGRGYWLVASDGGVFTFGDASFFGSTGDLRLNQPIVGMTSTPSGAGYWMVARDGGIFSFGDAPFFGSTGAMTLNQPIVGMASTASGRGYWLVASDGGVFTFGDAPFQGAALVGSAPVYGLTPDGKGGYTVLRTDGSVSRLKNPEQPSTPAVTMPSVAPTTTTRPPAATTPTTSAPVTTPVTTPVTAPMPTTTTTTPPVVASGNPFSSKTLWVDPTNPAKAQAAAWATSRPADAGYMTQMGNTAAAAWIGDWTGDLTNSVRAIVNAGRNSNSIPVMVAYNIPGRDCGQWSAGGASSAANYRAWIDQFAAGLGEGPSAIVLEPDALAQMDCLDGQSTASRYALLRYAVQKLSAKADTAVYLDAGHPGWHSASDMAVRLNNAGIADARGFALNVSNYNTTSENTTYGDELSGLVGNKPFVVDTSRNGNGSNGEWCNPLGRALGATPTTSTGDSHVDALLWLKRPGESDGYCNGGPSAGVWWPDYALNLAKSAWG